MNTSNIIRIGTRDSQLALWQADTVKNLLEKNGHQCVLVPVKSEGDIDLVTPLYAMGVEGVFTKTLDAYLLSHKIDIAVHSMKDVPTQLAEGIVQSAVLKRGSTNDVFIPNYLSHTTQHVSSITNPLPFINYHLSQIIATGSIRRKAQWLHRFPETKFENLRGNVQTRLK
jgi:hydroxymethylbilane synthase